MWFSFVVVLQLLPQLTLGFHCPNGCVCDLTGSANCTGDLTNIPPLDPTITFLLQLNNTRIKVLNERSFQNFSLLLRLMLTFSSLDTIHPEAFHGALQLRSIKLSSNALTVLPPRVFSELSNLEQLHLDDNQIVSISSELFEGLRILTELDISKNRISQMDANVFQSLTNLIFLNLAGNQLRKLPQTVFHNLRALKSLALYSNQLETLGNGSFDHLNNLLVLLLHKNQIQEIPGRLFWYMPSLLTLTLSSNQLRYIPAKSFYNLSNLTKLTIYKNPLISLPDQLMGHMPRLQELYLFETNLTTVPWNLFANMTGLIFLNLHLNDKMTFLPKDLFCCLPNLKKLSLRQNNLKELHPDLFSNLTSLQLLILYGNKLQSLPGTIFQHSTELQKLELKRNHLKYLPGDVFVHARALKALSLSGNKWNCDCSIIGIAEWIRENANLVNDMDMGVACLEPHHLQNHPLQTLTHEDLHCGEGGFQGYVVSTYMTLNLITTGAPTTSSLQPTTSTTERNNKTDAATRSSTATIQHTSLSSPTSDDLYVKQGNKYKNDPAFYKTIVLDNGPEIVHNNRYSGWVYLWTVPTTGFYSGFMMALYIILLTTGVILIVASVYALYQLNKVMWVVGTVAVGDDQKIKTRRVRSFKVKL